MIESLLYGVFSFEKVAKSVTNKYLKNCISLFAVFVAFDSSAAELFDCFRINFQKFDSGHICLLEVSSVNSSVEIFKMVFNSVCHFLYRLPMPCALCFQLIKFRGE